ncbi:MAG TPA: SpoIIE family protein phosphatase, partial [Phycisphaerae bacterium]|nr:SpoIIE family protein phosphatase [Phycisphaerae bacterium]
MKHDIDSNAFHVAALGSERLRIIGMLILFGGLALIVMLRALFYPLRHSGDWTLQASASLAVFAGYEACMLMVVRRAERRGRRLSTWIWIPNTIVETLVPTAALIGLTSYQDYVGPYKALVSATVLVYPIIIILSTLRLSPLMSLAAGVLSACGYGLVFAFTQWAFPKVHPGDVMPVFTFAVYPTLLVVAGIIAAGVARQIRQHVIAALAEVETRRKLDRVEHDLQIARAIQMGLLPSRAPHVPGYEIAGWSQPADQTGGDYYDWMELPAGRILFTVADAAGHGIGPALLVAACRAYFRAIATHTDPLEKITAQVDRLLAADVPPGRFITAVVALLEPAEHRLSLYSAGHAPLYFYKASGDEVLSFDSDQPPLGVHFSDGDARARVLAMEPGDALI